MFLAPLIKVSKIIKHKLQSWTDTVQFQVISQAKCDRPSHESIPHKDVSSTRYTEAVSLTQLLRIGYAGSG